MTTYAYADSFADSGVGINGIAVTAWDASRFGSQPAVDTPVPSGSPDAGPVTTGENFGADGEFVIELPTTDQYYLSMAYGGHIYWIGPVVGEGAITSSPTGAAGGDLSGSYPNPSVAKVNGVAITSGEATILSQLNGAYPRNASATVAAGETTVFSGSTAAQTLTLPVTPQASTCNTVANLASVSVTVAAGAGNAISDFGTGGSVVLAPGQIVVLTFLGIDWYVEQLGTTVAAETTRATTAEGLLAPKASPTFSGTTTAPEFSASGLTGAVAASRYVGATASAAPSTGTFAVGDFVIDQTGKVWVCTAAGTPGTWTNTGSGGGGAPTGAAGGDLSATYPNPTVAQIQGEGITSGQAQLLSTGTGNIVTRSATATATACETTYLTGTTASQTLTLSTGLTLGVNTVINYSSQTWTITGAGTPSFVDTHGGSVSSLSLPSGSMLQAFNDGGSVWVVLAYGPLGVNLLPLAGGTMTGALAMGGNALTGASDVAVSGLTGAVAASRYVGATASAAPSTGTFAVGDFVIDQTGKVWVCTAAGTPGTWTNTGGAPSGSAGGDLSGSYPNPSVAKVNGVAIGSTQATLLSQLSGVANRTSSATAAAGEQTILTGTTASQTLTLPSAPTNGTGCSILNLSTQSWTLAAGGTDTFTIIGGGGGVSAGVVPKGYLEAVYLSGVWYFTFFGYATQELMSIPEYDPAGIAQQVLGTTATQTVTNKRITRRVSTTNAPGATPSMDTDNDDVFAFTGLAAAITSMTTNLTGTPVAGDQLIVQLTDNGTARAITWGASFEASTVALPTTTVASAMLMVAFIWNPVTSKWRCYLKA